MKILLFCTVFVAKGTFAQFRPLQPVETVRLPYGLHLQPEARRTAVPANWQVRNMGIICRYEYRLESAIRLPVRFRLGSLSHCNWLEQKPNAGRSYPLP